jgi:hypothetical protein
MGAHKYTFQRLSVEGLLLGKGNVPCSESGPTPHCRAVAQVALAVAKCGAISMEHRLTYEGRASISHGIRVE